MVGVGIEVETADQVDEKTLMMFGNKGMSALSMGEKVRVLVQEKATSRVEVRVYTKRKMATNVFAKGDWSNELFDRIQQEVGTGSIPP